MSEDVNNSSIETAGSSDLAEVKPGTLPAPGRIKFVGVMNIINAVLLLAIGLIGFVVAHMAVLLIYSAIGALQFALGYYLFRMNRIVWVINVVLYGLTVIASIYLVAEALYAGQYFGSVKNEFLLMLYFLVMETCLVSSWRRFFG